jgi:hypothetical protein
MSTFINSKWLITLLIYLLMSCNTPPNLNNSIQESEPETVYLRDVSFELIEPKPIIVLPDDLRDNDFDKGYVRFAFTITPTNEIQNVYVFILRLQKKSGDHIFYDAIHCKMYQVNECPVEVRKYMPLIFSGFQKTMMKIINHEDTDVRLSLRLEIE